MKHYKAPSGEIYAYESDGSQDTFIPANFVAIPDEELAAYRAARTPPPTAAEIRRKRNSLIAETDWTQLPDTTVDKNIWLAYRKALRDIPEQAGFPVNVIWPKAPDS